LRYGVGGSEPIPLKSYHHPSMAQGTRIQVILPNKVAAALKARAAEEQRPVSNLAAYIIEAALRATTSS
jgi:hypothetical protein